MSLFSLPVSERIDILLELLSCSDPIYHWIYASDGMLLTTNCKELILDRIFRHSGCLDKILEHAASYSNPMIMSVPLGLTWCAAFEQEDGSLSAIHVLGPVAIEGISRSEISSVLDASPELVTNRARLFRAFEHLPIHSLTGCNRNLQMLHYCLTGDKIQTADILYTDYTGSTLRSGKKAPAKDRMQT